MTDANHFFGLTLGKRGLARVHEGGGGNRCLYHRPRDFAIAAKGGAGGAGGADGAAAFTSINAFHACVTGGEIDSGQIGIGCTGNGGLG